MAHSYIMEAKENYDATRIAAIEALSTYIATFMNTDQKYQGMQWDPVRRNLMYLYTENLPSSATTNTTGHTLWDGATGIIAGQPVDPASMFNSYVCSKNIDTDAVTFYQNYNSANVVPAGINGGNGTWRRYTRDFRGESFVNNGNGPGMTDPYTGNFWIDSQSCELYCFRLQDNYSQVISPLFPVYHGNNNVKAVGFTNSGATNPWTFAREIDTESGQVYLYLVPRLLTATEITADYLLIYATFTYPTTTPTVEVYWSYNREVFDHAGNMFLFTCSPSGGKSFALYKFTPPTSAPYGGPTVGGGFADITPWGSSGPNADGADYTLARDEPPIETADIIPMYLPATDDLVLIEKFFPAEHTASSLDPALMFWSCTYVHAPAGSPTYNHHSAFVTGYMTQAWAPTDISGAGYAVYDAFEVNNYLGQSDYLYDIDYTSRWFFFVCQKMTAGVADGVPRIVLVEYSFVYGSAPAVVQVIDEQGWDDAYPGYGPITTDAYAPYDPVDTPAVAVSMETLHGFPDFLSMLAMWDNGIFDPTTNSFWWSGGATNADGTLVPFCQFDAQFADRMQSDTGTPSDGVLPAATPPFLKLSFTEDDAGDATADHTLIRAWPYSLDGHDYIVLRLGPSATLVYDITTQQWAHWQTEGRDNWRPICGTNWAGMTTTLATGTDVVCGDDTTGVIWRLDPTKGRDDRTDTGDQTFTRTVTGGFSLSGRDLRPCNALELTVSLGAPSQTGAAFTLSTSDDLGQTWLSHGTQEVTASDYSAVLEWRALGVARQPGRIFKITDDGAAVRIGRASLR